MIELGNARLAAIKAQSDKSLDYRADPDFIAGEAAVEKGANAHARYDFRACIAYYKEATAHFKKAEANAKDAW